MVETFGNPRKGEIILEANCGTDLVQRYLRDPLLQRWVKQGWLNPYLHRGNIQCRGGNRWLVVDNFFNENELDRLIEKYSGLTFQEDDVGLNYDSTAIRVDREDNIAGLELLKSQVWREYVTSAMGIRPYTENKSVIKYRRHPPSAHGFWIHTDQDRENPKSLAVLGYFNKDWTSNDGGKLQLWNVEDVRDEASAHIIYRWDEYYDRPLTFLEEARKIRVEAMGLSRLEVGDATLVAEIEPIYNRLVFLDFQGAIGFHSVTPSHGREREGFLQWIF